MHDSYSSQPTGPTPRPDTHIRIRAIAAAELIEDWVRAGLPVVDFNIHPWAANAAALLGQVNPHRLAADGYVDLSVYVQDVVNAYASHLEMDASERPGGYYRVDAITNGVNVRIWGQLVDVEDGGR